MVDRKLGTTRRNLIVGLGATGLASAVIISGRLSVASPEGFVALMAKRALPDALIPDGVLERFAADYVSELYGDRLKSLIALTHLSVTLTTTGIDMLLSANEKYKNFRRTAVTQFLVRTNYFTTSGGKTGRLEYFGYLPCGQNPFAQFG
ncbi:hypothetical protein [Erythrobacter ani]|uniref:Gluconate 2-dehydrogenase subunit 3 family protein n=1 Tax=Erythrobacter ani TaxID=2827235 RepID=A0ABS6SP46_9SPHN|nr:hypothetical protein [Erythrobacter ani]MBV7266272.1 hypothetical protein [Erythrobacter ani]